MVHHGIEAVQLPHWLYFENEYKEHNVNQESNRQLIRERWGA
jgi:hypothetical protein